MVANISRAAKADFYIHAQQHYGAPTGRGHARGEHEGTWWNPSNLLTDQNPELAHGLIVDPARFYRLYRGFHPRTGEKLARTAGAENRCPAYDLVLSADKTISTLWAIADPTLERKLRRLQERAVHATIEDVVQPHCAFTRIRRDGNSQQIQQSSLFGALFQHGASRSGDPHLHTRAVLFNLAHVPGQAKWRSLHARALYIWYKAIGAVYRAELAWLLAHDLGLRTERHGPNGEYTRISGVPPNLLDLWSSRTSQLRRIIQDPSYHGPVSGLAKETIRRRTTNTTIRHLSADDRRIAWQLDVLQHGIDIRAVLQDIRNPELNHTLLNPNDDRLVAETAETLVQAARNTSDPLTHQGLLAQTANISAGRLSRQQRAELFTAVRDHKDIAALLQPVPFHHGKTIKAVQKKAAH